MLARENFLPSRPAVAAKIALPGNETSSLGRSSLIVAILFFLDRLFCISLNTCIFYLFLSGVTSDLPMVCGGTPSEAGVAWPMSVRAEHVETSDPAHLSGSQYFRSGHQLIVL